VCRVRPRTCQASHSHACPLPAHGLRHAAISLGPAPSGHPPWPGVSATTNALLPKRYLPAELPKRYYQSATTKALLTSCTNQRY
jgi:hypothetical protein